MSKELIENLLIEFDEMGFEPTILCDQQKEIDSFRNRLKQILDYLETIDNSEPSKMTLKDLVSKQILNQNSVVEVYEQDKNNPHYSNRIFKGMAWEMEKQDIGNRKLKYIFSAVAETIDKSDRVCIEVKEDD